MGLITKEVYCGDGNYIGKVFESYLDTKKNKIHSLVIKLNAKHKKKYKTSKAFVNYKYVTGIGDTVFLNKNVRFNKKQRVRKHTKKGKRA